MFKKTGDNLQIQGYIDGSGVEQICKKCHKPLITVAIKEDDSINLICKCNNSDIMELN